MKDISKFIRVIVRQKQLKGNKKSLYLDFYPAYILPDGSKTRRHFLNLRIYTRPRNESEKQENKDSLLKAEKAKNTVQYQIDNNIYGLSENEIAKKTDFIVYLIDTARDYKNSTQNTWSMAIKHFTEFAGGNLLIGDLSIKTLLEFQKYLIKVGLNQNSIILYYSKIKTAIRKLFAEGVIEKDLAYLAKTIVKSEASNKEYLNLEELVLLAKTPCKSDIVRRAFLFSVLTGLRYSDINKLVWGEVIESQSEGCYLKIKTQKTSTFENIALNKEAVELLGIRGNPSDLVFNMPNPQTANNILEVWTARAGFDKHITFHCARHTFATLQLTIGTPIYTVSKLLGHSDIKTTQVYAKIIDATKRKAIDNMPNIGV